MYIPSITSLENALKIYYENTEIGNKEIKYLFGNHSSATISRLKKLVKTEMLKNGVSNYCANKVNTEIAFKVWGLDAGNLKNRFQELNKLKIL